jgi:indolepyruvate ferredoxin oxidoreductase alpha subunit
MKQLMIGNEAIARGAYEAGATVAAAYPGTPSTEIVSTFAKYDQVLCPVGPLCKCLRGRLVHPRWSPYPGSHEACRGKCGRRSFIYFCLYWSKRRMVLVSAEDTGMHSSQNERDNRGYGKFAKMPVLEHAGQSGSPGLLQLAFTISRNSITPVMLRITTVWPIPRHGGSLAAKRSTAKANIKRMSLIM